MSSRTWIFAIILIISLALNLFFGGFLLGRVLSRGDGGPPIEPLSPRMMHFVKQLPEAKQTELKPLVHSYRRAFRTQIRKMRQARLALLSALEKEPLDEAELQRLFAELRQEQDTAGRILHEHLLKIVKYLPPEQRKQALMFKPEGRRRPKHGRRHHEPEPPPIPSKIEDTEALNP